MRKAGLVALVFLAGCQQQATQPVEPKSETKSMPGTIPAVPATGGVGSLAPSTPLRRVEHFRAIGTEPFWSFEVLDSKMIYTSPENQVGIAIATIVSSEGKLLRFSGSLQDKPVVLTIEAGECSDGMSDRVYSHKATFAWGTQTERGCAWRQ